MSGLCRSQEAATGDNPSITNTIDAAESDGEEPRRKLVSWNEYEGPYFTLRVGAGFGYDLNMCRGDAPITIVGRDRNRLAKLYLWISFNAQQPRSRFREAYFLPYAKELKPVLNIPLILVGGIRHPETAERIVEAGQADMISMARPLIREPGLLARWMKGDRSTAQCQSCNRCLGEIEQGNKLKCYLKGDDK